jgi:hypothetical protein
MTMNKRTLLAIATIAGIAAISGSAAAESQRGYTCRSGGVTITSLSPCYVTSYGISVPGDFSLGTGKGGKEGHDNPADGPGGKKGGGFGGPKDIKDKGKPKGGGFGGPKDVKDKN